MPNSLQSLSRYRKVLFSVVTMPLVLLVSAVLVEGVLRALPDPLLRSMCAIVQVMYYRNHQGMVLTPGIDIPYTLPSQEASHRIRINQQGFRMNRPVALNPEPGTHRIMVLGDSMTFGLGVEGEDAYPARLERLLNQEVPSGRYEVINAGFEGGICPLPQYVYLRDRAPAFDPDTILVGFFAGNDLRDMTQYIEVKRADGLPAEVLARGGDVPPWIKRTASYQFFKSLSLGDDLLPKRQGLAPAGIGSFGAEERAALGRTEHLFKAMRDVTLERGEGLMLLFIPSYQMLFGRDQKEGEEWARGLHDPFLAFCRSENIDCLDLSPELEKGGPSGYFPVDQHLTAKGHRIVAAAIARHMLSGNDGSGKAQ